MTRSPVVRELTPVPDVESALAALAHWPDVLLFDSALRREHVGRYSYLTADPVQFFIRDRVDYGDDLFGQLRSAMKASAVDSIPGLPPFQGGMAGLLSYEAGRAFERIPFPALDEFRMPALAVGLFDWVIAWDHLEERCWLIVHGCSHSDADSRRASANRRADRILDQLATSSVTHSQHRSASSGGESRAGEGVAYTGSSACKVAPCNNSELSPVPIDRDRLNAVTGTDELYSNFQRDAYLKAVGDVVEYIHAGDIFQANVSQRLLSPARRSSIETYSILRQNNPAPFAAYFRHDDWALMSASPERFVSVDSKGGVESRPIKGTRRRKHSPEADLFTRDELRQSEKDMAENVMIVDLLRNDLSRVCRPGSIRVPSLCRVETYETVQHLVSVISGRLRDDADAWNLLEATFPGGSITGAPKVRAMQIINELEQTARGPYCGSLFHVGFDGSMDSNILIRTLVQRGGWLQCSVGGGIVAQSSPVDEFNETLHKASGMLPALTSERSIAE